MLEIMKEASKAEKKAYRTRLSDPAFAKAEVLKRIKKPGDWAFRGISFSEATDKTNLYAVGYFPAKKSKAKPKALDAGGPAIAKLALIGGAEDDGSSDDPFVAMCSVKPKRTIG